MSLLKRVLAFAALFFTVSLTTVQTGAAQNANYPPAVQNIVANLPTIKDQANSGNPQAQFFLGQAYYNGWGVPKDLVESVKWVRKAADQGLPLAQYALSFSYANGEGVPKDLVESVKWVRKAAEQGYAPAQFTLGQAYFNGIGGLTRDVVTSVKWVRKAAEQGYPPALFVLGKVYLNGVCVPQDVNVGLQLIRFAAHHGYQPAIQVLNRYQPVVPPLPQYPIAGTMPGSPSDVPQGMSQFPNAVPLPLPGSFSGIPQGGSGMEILQDIYQERATGVSTIENEFIESQERARLYQFMNDLKKETEETYNRQMEMNKLYNNGMNYNGYDIFHQ